MIIINVITFIMIIKVTKQIVNCIVNIDDLLYNVYIERGY